jgi:20S proteasome alpha/beta subunit
MTLVVGLFNQSEVVLAADTITLDESSTVARKPYHKLRHFGPHLFSAAGTQASFEIYKSLINSGLNLDADIQKAAHALYKASREIYREQYATEKQRVSMLLAGLDSEGKPDVYVWNFPKGAGAVSQSHHGRASIGMNTYSLFFVRCLHEDSMTTEQRIQLAHFAITSTVQMERSQCVGLPVDVWRLSSDGVREYSQQELEPFIRRNGELSGQLRQMFATL